MKEKRKSGKAGANRDIEFLYEIGSLRYVERSWRQHMGMECASDPEHTFRVIWIALLLARMEGKKVDEALITRMALVHDLPETRTGDPNYIHKVYGKTDDEKAAKDLFAGTVFADYHKDFHAYEMRELLEAKLVKDADNLDVDLELKEMEERGSKLVAKLAGTRRLVRDMKLHTKSGKKLWDLIQKSDVSSWHRSANKWVKLPNTGR